MRCLVALPWYATGLAGCMLHDDKGACMHYTTHVALASLAVEEELSCLTVLLSRSCLAAR